MHNKKVNGRAARYLILCCLLSCLSTVHAAEPGNIRLTVVDTATGEPVPVRLQVRDADGQFYVADDAHPFGGDCDMSDAGAGYTDLTAALKGFKDRLHNPYHVATEFYTEGRATLSLPAGKFSIAAFKGPEFQVGRLTLEVEAGRTRSETIELERWVNMPAKGWYSADDHLHIQRPHPDLNPNILVQMQAEDIHVANLLQMGKVRNFDIAPQYAFGKPGHYQKGDFILAAGQENPRTHYLGHTITLGAPEPIFDAARYLIYRHIWEASVANGGLNGFAHAGFEHGAVAPYAGLGVLLPHDLLHFLEVLQFNRGGYQVWYDVLNLGFRVTPTAGTDYPCADQTIPGHERFYTRVEGDFNYTNWLEAVRAGRTFVTTGPMLQMKIGDVDIGGEVLMEAPGEVRIKGKLTFNKMRDRVDVLELIRNGELIHQITPTEGGDTVELDHVVTVTESSWFALRAYGSERSYAGFSSPFHFSMLRPTSNAHTGVIYVTLKDRPAIGDREKTATLARAWLTRLEDLEATLSPENLPYLGPALAQPDFDGVPVETLAANRDALLVEIERAKTYFRGVLQRSR